MIQTIHQCWEQVIILLFSLTSQSAPVTLLCIAPLTNIAKAVEFDPSIVPKVKRLVIMGGDIKRNPERGLPEYNISADIPASKTVFEQDWEIVLAPLDSTMLIQLDNERYAKVSVRIFTVK
jgi:inosine-uridine nucleoside N-ribohydrolase